MSEHTADVQTVEAAPAPEARSGRGLVVFTAVMTFAAGAVSYMLAPLLPVLQRDYSLSLGEVALVFTLIVLGGGVSVVLLPRSADALGDRGAAALGTGLMTAGTLVAGAVQTYPALLVGASLMGLGAATSQIGVGILRRHLPGTSVRTAVTVTQVAHALGGGAGLIAGGIALSYVDMRGFFFSAAAIYALIGVFAMVMIPRSPRNPDTRFGAADLVGLVVWVVALLYGIKLASSSGFLQPLSIVLLVVGLLGGAAWLRFERRSAAPVLHLDLLRSPVVAKTVVAGISIGMAIQAVTFLIPFYVQRSPDTAGFGFGFTVLDTGLVLLPYALAAAVSSVVAGTFISRGRPLFIAGVGAACHAVAGLTLALNLAHLPAFVVAAVVYGIGSGMVAVGLFGSVQSAVPEKLAGMGTSMVGIVLTISGSLGPAIYSAVLQASATAGPAAGPSPRGFVVCFVIALCVDLAVALLCVLHRYRATPATPAPRSAVAATP
ncbi:MFS transporter [Pseudonocardia ailaonensis]|uniref:MFS transporter n=1 Tax=Pseudonocardia ailaonensis TaxID=367279 RepID=A0ABN2N557_9PSEU